MQNILPETYTANITRAQSYIHNTPELKDIVLDLRGATALTELGIFSSNSTYFAKGIKGVRVSNEAPFNRATTPQIDVRYTNLDRSALVQLFNDLPTVSSGQIINITGTTGSEKLKAADLAIATNKGWTVSGGLTPVLLFAYTDGNNNTIYAKDEDLQGTYKAFNTNSFTNNNIVIDENGYAIFPPTNNGDYIVSNSVFDTSSTSWKMHLEFDLLSIGGTYYSFLSFDGRSPKGLIMQANASAGLECVAGGNGSWQFGINVQDFTFESNKTYSIDFAKNEYVYTVGASEGSTDTPTQKFQDTYYNTLSGDYLYFENTLASDCASAKLNLAKIYCVNAGVKTTLAILNTTSQLYDGDFEKITATAEHYDNVIKIGNTIYTRDSAKDTSEIVPN